MAAGRRQWKAGVESVVQVSRGGLDGGSLGPWMFGARGKEEKAAAGEDEIRGPGLRLRLDRA